MISRLPVRWRLTAAFAAGMVVVLALAGAFVYVKVRSDLTESLDESLAARADVIAALVASGDVDGSSDLAGERQVDAEDGFVQLLRPGGGVAASTLDFYEPEKVISPAEAAKAVAGPLLLERSVRGIDGEARILLRSVTTPDGQGTVVVGATTEDRTEALAGLTGAFAIGGPIAILVASLLGYLLAGRALAPVEAMRRRATGITLERSGERLPLPAADDELHRLGETLNGMLDRIEATLERERVFVADASHELRTPLAILRSELELAAKPGRAREQLRNAIRSAAEEVDRLSRLAEDLLVIARSDQGRLPIKRERVRLAPLLERVRSRFAARSRELGRSIEVTAPEGTEAELDPLRIEQALGNLVDNALRHGAGAVELGASVDDGRVTLEVRDQGPGFPDGFGERAFERFTRADDGRAGGGTGLGLAIVRAIATAHDGEARAEGATVTLSVKRRDSSRSHP